MRLALALLNHNVHGLGDLLQLRLHLVKVGALGFEPLQIKIRRFQSRWPRIRSACHDAYRVDLRRLGERIGGVAHHVAQFGHERELAATAATATRRILLLLLLGLYAVDGVVH